MTKHGWDRQLHSEVDRLLEQARANTQPRKHHIVPASYLQRWAVDDRIRVHILDDTKTFVTSPRKAARRTDFYRAESPDLDEREVPPMLFETILSRVEGEALNPIDQLLTSDVPLNFAERTNIASFVAFQYVRGDRHRERFKTLGHETFKIGLEHLKDDADVGRWLEEIGESNDAESIAEAIELLKDLRNDNVRVVPPDVQAMWTAFSVAESGTQLILDRPWVLGLTTTPLVTSDEPVMAIGGPGTSRDEMGGIGTAGLVVMPLSPHHLLIAVRPDLADMLGMPTQMDRIPHIDLDVVDSVSLSREIVMHAADLAFELPSQNLVRWLSVPPRPADVTIDRFVSIDGDGSEIIRHFNYSRWQGIPWTHPWPLSDFWPPGWSAVPVPLFIGDRLEEVSDRISDR